LDGAYGKYAKDETAMATQIFMEYNELFPFLIPSLPQIWQNNDSFMDWIRKDDILE